ncbi:hypothetical protein K2X30_03565 [bacterium]|jgi:hypothetical protein|nr:hypothetical protein [bacterium]
MFILQVCGALNKAKIGYAIVGGYAVALHGAVRGTVDLDIVLDLSEKDYVASEKVFTGLGLQCRLPVSAKQVFRFRQEYIENRNLVAWSFFDPIRPANQMDVIITHDQSKMKVEILTIQGVKVRVASIPDLIKMKKDANRPQDLEDIAALRKLQKK